MKYDEQFATALSRANRVQARFFNDFVAGYANAYSHPVDAILGIFALLAGICSIFILAIEVSAILTLRSSKPIISVGKTNTKDALALPLSRPKTLSVLGNPRATIIPIYFPQPVVKSARVVKKVLAHLLFNRVRSVETRIYTLIQNLFALVSMVVLIFQTVAALQQAQNEVQTRVISADCGLASSSHNISILVDRPYWEISSEEEINVAISAVTPSGGGFNCTVGWSRKFMNGFYPAAYQNRMLELFNCTGVLILDINDWEAQYYSSSTKLVYRVQVRPGVKPGITEDGQMPHVWLLNTEEIPDADHDPSWSDVSRVRAYQAPLNLLCGSHIVTETNLVTRRFIRSSVLKEILFSAKSDYRRLSLYPISLLSTMALNSTDTSISRATIRPTLAPGLRYHRTQANVQDSSIFPSDTCDFVDDYRVGTVFNALGSIGGLFALLQAIHLLLFGRPLLWSITGAKTITPFGLLGGFSSRGFRQRLRAEYHEPGEDGADIVRIVPFLRDFVLDFGPADFNMEHRPSRKPSISSLTLGRDSEDLDETQM
ncbi:unnamed protein product [Rhizoctonia solani]|uniref:Uncharacterized protein n=1 Tax=Rhizoctonia solani TaxID=456999 RepID=A0A8H3H9N1_9AGAM|nr:unnamed protein product [Rhizoctonia solani]